MRLMRLGSCRRRRLRVVVRRLLVLRRLKVLLLRLFVLCLSWLVSWILRCRRSRKVILSVLRLARMKFRVSRLLLRSRCGLVRANLIS